METPTSDFESNGDITPSDASTPSTVHQPFEARFQVRISEPVKDGHNITYPIQVSKVKTGEEITVWREYEDFEWLHHNLCTLINCDGLLIPPLPSKSLTDVKDVPTVEEFKRNSDALRKHLISAPFYRECKELQKYLEQVVAHSVLGEHSMVESFLTEKEPSQRSKLKQGLFGKLSSNMDVSRKAGHKDIDEWFQEKRDWSNKNAVTMKATLTAFQKRLESMQKLASGYGHLSTALNLGGAATAQDGDSVEANRILVDLGEALEDLKQCIEADANCDDDTLGFCLDLYARYAESLKEMHYRRTCLMIAYEDANKALSKAKPNKVTQAEEFKLAAERKFEECSGTARREMENYRDEQVLFFRDSLTSYAEAKVKTAQDTYALLSKSLAVFQDNQE